LTAERTGLLGRAYVDIGGIHAAGDRWLEATATQLDNLGFDLTVDRDPATMPPTARIDAPVLYFGWYTGNLNGPFTPPEFRFPPGAIALHIHSYSAQTLRSRSSGWVGPLLARGVTATMGNVFEPYLELTHQPQLFLKALARGATLVDAAYYALPALSWQTILIGDPLYRPFTVSLDEQMNHFAALPPRLAGYAALRRLRQLEATQQPAAALALARKTQGVTPSLPLGYALAARLRDSGDLTGAAQALGFASLLPAFQPDEWALAEAAAQLLATAGRPAQAVDIYLALFATKILPTELRTTWLPHAIETAKASKDFNQVRLWNSALAELTPPPAPTAPTAPGR
ncbi:MAG: TIGR03790 family protein, partial [Undibacterium sp.]|nr:TIGR03790 family protein [Opitutaceae bacterium]